MKLSTNTIIIALGAVILGFLALITVGLLVAPFSAKPVDSQATVQAIVAQTMAALQNVPVSIPQTGSTSPTPTLRPIGGSSLTVAMLQNAQYHSKTWGDYQLADGIFYRPTSAPGETPELYSTQLYLPTFGDLNSDGTDDAAYLHILRETLPKLMDKVQPDLVFYQSGVDVLASDKLGRLSLSLHGCRERDRTVFETCRRNAVPVVACMGGGYSPRVADIVEAHANTFRMAQETFF